MATGNEKVHPAANIFPMMSGQALQELVEDIRQHGQREPVVYWKQQLLDGRNRLEACKQLGIEPQTCELDDEVEPIAYVLSANLHRRHLDESQRSMAGAKVKEVESKLAKERQRAAGKQHGRGKKKVRENLPEPISTNGRASDKVAEAVGVSRRSVDHASTVLKEGSPELIAAVDAGEVAVSKAAKVAKTTPKKKQVDEAKKTTPKKQKSPFSHLCYWWKQADSAAQTRFRLWIDGECT